jgi:hypothetical protein
MKKNMITAAFSLMSAIAAYSAAIPITSVPSSITSPGVYTLVSDLVCTANQPAITINSPTAGKIILDLGGFTISDVSVLADGIVIANRTNSTIIIRNGSLEAFDTAINANSPEVGYISNVQIQNIQFFFERRAGVSFNQLNASSVTDCSFTGQCEFGIVDVGSRTGNRYASNTSDGLQFYALAVGSFYPTTVTIDCHIQPSPTP